MGKIIIKKLEQENIFSYYLAIFRVFLSLFILNKIYHIWGNQSILFYENVLYVQPNSLFNKFGLTQFIIDNSSLFLLSIVFLLILMFFGIGRRITIIALYFHITLLQSLTNPILNGGDNLMIFMILYMIFTNSYNHFVLFKNNNKSSNTSIFISNIASYSIMIHLCYIYLLSGLHKTHSDVWFNGTAIYYILHIERFQSPLAKYIMENGIITTISTYITILFELLFCVLIWNKKLRNSMILIGIFLHLGIYFFMMIYDFEILFISLYGFFISNQEWSKIFTKIKLLINKQIKYAY